MTSLAEARQFCAGFFYEYNYVHHHSGIAWHTPASVHFGTADTIDEARQTTLTAAYYAHPERFARRPLPPQMPTQFWINQPAPETQKKLTITVSLDLTNTALIRSPSAGTHFNEVFSVVSAWEF